MALCERHDHASRGSSNERIYVRSVFRYCGQELYNPIICNSTSLSEALLVLEPPDQGLDPERENSCLASKRFCRGLIVENWRERCLSWNEHFGLCVICRLLLSSGRGG